MNTTLSALFNFEYKPEVLKSKVISALTENMLLSDTKQLRQWHAEIFKDIEWYAASKRAVHIKTYPYIYFDGEQIVACTDAHNLPSVTNICDLCKKINDVKVVMHTIEFEGGRKATIYDDKSVLLGDVLYSKEEFQCIINEIQK